MNRMKKLCLRIAVVAIATYATIANACSVNIPDTCGHCTGCSYWVLCGITIGSDGVSGGLSQCTGDSPGAIISNTTSAPTGGYSTPLPGICRADVTLDPGCCGGSKTTTTTTYPIIQYAAFGTCGG